MEQISRNVVVIASLLWLTACSQQGIVKRIKALDSGAWNNSEWISAQDAPVVKGTVNENSRAADGASWFTTTIKNEKKVKSVKWMTAGLGVYELYINGENAIGNEDFLKPGFTHYAKTKRSFTYEITSKVLNKKAGSENTFYAQVTPGWWADKIITPGGNDGMIGKKVAFRGVLEFTFADGTKKLYGTNTKDWKAAIAGPVRHAAIFDGEVYDNRVAQPFGEGIINGKSEINNEFSGEILPSEGAEITLREDLALSPVRAYVWKDIKGDDGDNYGTVIIEREYKNGEAMTVGKGENLVIDFGQNCSAVPQFVFSAKEGTTLRCVTSELLNDGNGAKNRGMDGPEGSVHRLNLRIPNEGMYIDYTFGKTDENKPSEFMPRHTFFGYRLVSITADDNVTIKSIRSIPVTSIAKNLETGTITTGNELINKLISNTIWGQRSNYLSVPTDCPQRNERLGWTADTQVFAETGTFFANTKAFFHKWMRDMRDTQSPAGAFPGVAPMAQYGSMLGDMMRVGWADAGVIVPWTIWKQFGDKQIIDENWTAMEKFIDHVNETHYDHNALKSENSNYQWADWLSYEPLESCSGRGFTQNGPKPEAVEYWNYLCASYWAIDAGMMRDMAAYTGRDVQKYETMVANAKEYLKERFLTNEGKFKTEILNTMQTPALFALKNKLVEGEAKKSMTARLRQNFADHGNCLQTGFLGTSILMSTLTENGMVDIAYELLFQRKNPSWLYSIDNGATTIWERWNSYMKDEGMGPQGMNSFNHYAYGAVCEWLWETAAGICADKKQPGFKHIIMSPVPDKRLGNVDATYYSAAGIIKSSWRYEGNEWIWSFTIPEGATATVTIPGGQPKEYQAGKYTIRK